MAVAEVLEFGEVLAPDELDATFELIVASLWACDSPDALARSDRYQNKLLAFDAQLLATKVKQGATDRETEKLAGRAGKRSKREAKKRARRARTVSKNPRLGTDLADEDDDLGPEKLDAISDASERTDGAAANDDEFITKVKDGSADDASKLADEYVDDHTSPDEHEQRRDRQRRARKLKRFTTKRGLDAILAEGDTETITEIWTQLTARSKQMYADDGGRDLPADQHPRSRNQRLFDALHETIITNNTNSTGSTGGNGTGKPVRAPAMVHLTLTIDEWLSDQTRARMAGGGTIPASLLNEYLADAWLRGTIFDGDGEILWHGRKKRHATPAQTSALTVRDQGCVLCHSHPQDCESHHLIPWNAPAKGQTNTPDMALVCVDCHHHLHANNLTLHRNPTTKRWKTRPATPNETPPPRQPPPPYSG